MPAKIQARVLMHAIILATIVFFIAAIVIGLIEAATY